MASSEMILVSFLWLPAYPPIDHFTPRGFGQHDGHADHGVGIIKTRCEETWGVQGDLEGQGANLNLRG